MIRRKVQKLLRDPNQFLLDFLKKRSRVEMSPTGARRDFTTDVSSPIDQVLAALRGDGIRLQAMRSEHAHQRRFAIRDTDIGRLVQVASDLRIGSYKAHVHLTEQRPPYRGLATLHLEKSGVSFQSPMLVFDPWYIRNEFVRSDNQSPSTSLVLKENRDSTVWSDRSPGALGSLEDENRISQTILTTPPFPIDIVYTWVDGADSQWLKRRAPFLQDSGRGHKEDSHETRYENLEELRYSLRSVACFAPWVRKIFVVTDAQRPSWLAEQEQVVVIDHRDLFEDATCLPTFNSHAIEANLFRIPGLAEHFVYFNDDMLLLNPCAPTDFFHTNGISKSFYEPLSNVCGPTSESIPGFANAARNGSALLVERFGRSAHSYHRHTPYSLRRSVFEDMWRDFPDALAATSRARFRSSKDISTASFLYHYYAHELGKSVPGDIASRLIGLGDALLAYELGELAHDCETLALCLNGQERSHPEKAALLAQFFAAHFPGAASWER